MAVYNKRIGSYICSICNKKFTRKWTAQRHNRDVHKNQSQIYDRLNNLIPNLPLLSSEDISDPKVALAIFGRMLRNQITMMRFIIHSLLRNRSKLILDQMMKFLKKLGN